MGVRERRERQREALRREILDAARELFVTEGYENVSMRRIAEKIEYSPTTIYLYFEDKADLLHNICQETFSKLARRLDLIRRRTDDPAEALRAGLRAYVDFGLKYPDHYRVTFMLSQEHQNREVYLREDSMGLLAFNHLRDSVAQCIQAKRLADTDLDLASQALWAAVHGVTALLIAKPNFPWADRNAVIDAVIDNMIRGMST